MYKSMKAKSFTLFTILLGAILFSSAPVMAQGEPNYGAGISIDGNISDWDLSSDYFADLYQSGTAVKKNGKANPVTGKLYLRYDCGQQKLYVLYQAIDGNPIIVDDGNEVFVKRSDNSKALTSNSESFAWIQGAFSSDPNYAEAWEGSFSLNHDNEIYNVHSNLYYDRESQTCGNDEIVFILNCANAPDDNGGRNDYGDCPDIYGNPFHPIDQEKIRLGATVDGDYVSAYSNHANGDDTQDPHPTDDEDGVSFYVNGEAVNNDGPNGSPLFQKGDHVELRFQVYNNSGGLAELVGWIDWNTNGHFENKEQVALFDNIPSSSHVQTLSTECTVPNNADVPEDGETPIYSRFRLQVKDAAVLSSGKLDDTIKPTFHIQGVGSDGGGNTGEVEDYVLYSEDGGPVAVTLSGLDAHIQDEHVVISWESHAELNTAGYNVYRSVSKNKGYNKINTDLILTLENAGAVKRYEYTDNIDFSGTVYYKIEDVTMDGKGTFHGPIAVNMIMSSINTESEKPNEFRLYSNYPNPFNPKTTIKYSLPKSTHVTLTVYDMLGKTIRTLLSDTQTAGTHTITWDGRDQSGLPAASGIYYYRMTAQDYQASGRMVLAR